MYCPAPIDGCSIVILRRERRGSRALESGTLRFDGQTPTLGEDESRRVFTDDELQSLSPVVADGRIAGCRDFGFFLSSQDVA